ncbi:hypothetical protein, partial [Kamptonema formosum]|uniref:hypothetical protein n=1 Tax=Kamptonema formosum TaxID=331992 RepID=UPI001E4670A4
PEPKCQVRPIGSALTNSRLIEAAPVGENLCTNGTQVPEPKCQVRPARDWLEPPKGAASSL